MDAIIFIGFSLFLTLRIMFGSTPKEASAAEVIPEDTIRVAKLNDNFFEDPNAFCEMITAVGFPTCK